MSKFSTDKYFVPYDYNVSHGVLLIRCDRNYNDASSRGIDIICYGVEYLEVKQIFRGLEISLALKRK